VAPVTKRSVVYVDGFNLYYGAVRGSPHKWLDLERFFRLARPHDEIQAFAVDVLACSTCGGRLRFIATIEDPPVVQRLLAVDSHH
jgi:hypothetical protein